MAVTNYFQQFSPVWGPQQLVLGLLFPPHLVPSPGPLKCVFGNPWRCCTLGANRVISHLLELYSSCSLEQGHQEWFSPISSFRGASAPLRSSHCQKSLFEDLLTLISAEPKSQTVVGWIPKPHTSQCRNPLEYTAEYKPLHKLLGNHLPG